MKSIVLFATILRIILISAIISFTIMANAQNVAVNTTGTPADASAMLDVSSTSKGFLAPRMSTVQRTGIPSPANGLMVFDTDTKSYWFFSTTWKEITNGGGGNFSLPYNGSFSDPSKLFSITNTNTTAGANAIYGKTSNEGSGLTIGSQTAGVWGDNSSGYGVVGSSNSAAGTMGVSALWHGVLGSSGSADFAGVYGINSNGIGVMGVNASTATNKGAVTAINQSTGVALYAESTGGMAVYGKTNKSNGAAIYGLNSAIQGHAIRGSATGNDGVAIYGEAGNSNSNSYAAYFRNSNATNTKNVVQVDNLGTGNFLSLQDGLGDVKTSIAKNGNINTDGSISVQGTVSVKGNKGIVRSSTSAQMRFEVIPAIVEALDGSELSLCGDCTMYRTVNFPNAFSQPPAVSLGNQISGNGYADLLLIKVMSVTSTSCVLRIENNISYSLSFKGSWNLIAIGPE